MECVEITLNKKQRSAMRFLYIGWANEQWDGYPAPRRIDMRTFKALHNRGLCEMHDDCRATLTDAGLQWCKENLDLAHSCGIWKYARLTHNRWSLENAQAMRLMWFDQMRRQLPLEDDIPTKWYNRADLLADSGWFASVDCQVKEITYAELMDDEAGMYPVVIQF